MLPGIYVLGARELQSLDLPPSCLAIELFAEKGITSRPS